MRVGEPRRQLRVRRRNLVLARGWQRSGVACSLRLQARAAVSVVAVIAVVLFATGALRTRRRPLHVASTCTALHLISLQGPRMQLLFVVCKADCCLSAPVAAELNADCVRAGAG